MLRADDIPSALGTAVCLAKHKLDPDRYCYDFANKNVLCGWEQLFLYTYMFIYSYSKPQYTRLYKFMELIFTFIYSPVSRDFLMHSED